MIKKTSPCLLIMRGLSGSGKSYLAAQLAKLFSATHFNSDIIRKQLAGYAPLTRTKSDLGAGIYTPQMSYKTYKALLTKAESVLRSGQSVVVDATFLHPKSLEKQQQLAQKLAIPFVIIDLQVSMTCLRQRVAQRFLRADDPSEADVAVLEQQAIHYQPLNASKTILIIHNNDKHNVEINRIKIQLIDLIRHQRNAL
ncbi:MAG: AAA family ATPase [Methylococcales bacterium]|nr:AAA family ATPase [Methylococcales bacterium]